MYGIEADRKQLVKIFYVNQVSVEQVEAKDFIQTGFGTVQNNSTKDNKRSKILCKKFPMSY